MHSLKSRITMLTVIVTIVAVVMVTALSVFFIIKSEKREAEQTLLLLSETGQRNLDYYFDSVEKSIGRVAKFASDDLGNVRTEEEFAEHMERVRDYFDIAAHKTNGVLTYYYRVDPEYSGKVALSELLDTGSAKTIQNVTNNSSQPVISFGDTVIYGASNDTVRKHEQVSRRQVNEILKYIHVKP